MVGIDYPSEAWNSVKLGVLTGAKTLVCVFFFFFLPVRPGYEALVESLATAVSHRAHLVGRRNYGRPLLRHFLEVSECAFSLVAFSLSIVCRGRLMPVYGKRPFAVRRL